MISLSPFLVTIRGTLLIFWGKAKKTTHSGDTSMLRAASRSQTTVLLIFFWGGVGLKGKAKKMFDPAWGRRVDTRPWWLCRFRRFLGAGVGGGIGSDIVHELHGRRRNCSAAWTPFLALLLLFLLFFF